MSEGPLSARVRAGIEAFNRGDREAVIAALAEDVEWKRVDGLPDEGGVLHGREAVRSFLEPEVFAHARFEAIRMVEQDDVVLVHGLFAARGAASGIELDVESYVVYRFADGLVRRVENWRTREEAERSAGLRLQPPG